MTLHIMVVGDAPGNDSEIDCARGVACPTTDFRVAPCRSSADLVASVSNLLQDGELIDTLDLYDHGKPGVQNMGGKEPSAVLFDWTGAGFAIADELAPLLSETAKLRLLGCNTAADPKGTALIKKLRVRLGKKRLVFGTTCHIRCWAFKAGGFDPLLAHFLHSSTRTEMALNWRSRLRLVARDAGEDFALKIECELERIETQSQNPKTGLASCCAT